MSINAAKSTSPVLLEQDPGYGKIFAVLSRRRFWLLGGLSLGLVIAVFMNIRAKPLYTSAMRLLVESTYRSNTNTSSFVDSNIQIDYATQLNLLQSSSLFQKAADLLNDQYPGITGAELRSLKIDMLGDNQNPTKIVEIQYTALDPVKSREVLRAFQKVYTDYNREQQEKRLQKGLSGIDEQVTNVRQDISETAEALEVFRRKNNLFDANQRVTEITAAMNGIEQQKRTTQLEYDQAVTRLESLQQNLDLSSQDAVLLTRLNQSPRYQALIVEMQGIEVALNREKARFQPANPIVEALELRFRQQQSSLEEERRSILGDANLSSYPKWNADQLSNIDVTIANQIVETQAQIALLLSRLNSLTSQEQDLRAEINRLPKLLSEYEVLRPKLAVLQETLQTLLKNRQDLSLEIARGGFDWQVVEEPGLGSTDAADTLRRNLLLGVVAGLFIGGMAAFLRDMQDDTMHTYSELEQQVASLSLLGMTPQYLQAEESNSNFLPQFLKGQSVSPLSVEIVQWLPFREGLDVIYKNIQLNSFSQEISVRSLVVTSALAGEGKSTIALGLATSAARLHKRVLLIDADMRSPSLHKQLNLPNERGLSTLLASKGSVDSQDVIQSSNSSIDILTAGPIPSDSVTLLSSEWMQTLVSSFEQDYDLVIIDSPPILGTVDTIQIASCCGGVVSVARIDRITRGEFSQAISILQKLNLIGVIANAVKDLPNSYKSVAISDDEDTV
ncbi:MULTISPECIES: GumC family protein [Pseudanabaena]|jgi:polysaccharide biosynthesis transport protein|uniref:GumC family protein n=1 Tax=Pseudanabaena TaxID=1152 RepID=UPI002479AB05|nr:MULTISPECIES: tyrosine-protein kinase domain-containing protein [Pseudanabaena]MEA5489319.1 polysaccharide biosynthesis tyrosine autokinase [Pseudanabaena sp. CCNP1317]WGS74116.1 polysaccharide biosynthesis tyrosine autokinase [Pseudanabaena galeata CCNP1313]